MAPTKICTICNQELPFTNFAIHKGGLHGIDSSCKGCRKAINRRYYAKNREKAIKYALDWQAAHPEDTKQSRAVNNLKRKQSGKKKQDNSTYYLRNKSQITAKHRIYRHKNHEKVILNRRVWGQTFQGRLKIRVACQQRSRNLKTLTFDVAQRVYKENIEKYGQLTCELCFQPVVFEQASIDHFHPVSRQATYSGADINERANLGVAHGNASKEQCNNCKGNKTLSEWLEVNQLIKQGVHK